MIYVNPKILAIIQRFIHDPVVKQTAQALLLSIVKEKFNPPEYGDSDQVLPQINKTL